MSTNTAETFNKREQTTSSSPPLRYWTMRLLRRLTPQPAIEAMLDRGVWLTPGRDTRNPQESISMYEELNALVDTTLKDKTVCVVGYGGGFSLALTMLEYGVKKVILQDPFAPPRTWRNRQLPAERMSKYFEKTGESWVPKDEYVEIVEEHLWTHAEKAPQSVDMVVSSSVLEHVSEVDRLIEASEKLLRPGGVNVHLIDMRDHYFRYPFEMLCYSERTWQKWLNASNNLNRLRYHDYRTIFEKHFPLVKILNMNELPEKFKAMKHRIRPEFLSGDDAIDSIGGIRVVAQKASS